MYVYVQNTSLWVVHQFSVCVVALVRLAWTKFFSYPLQYQKC